MNVLCHFGLRWEHALFPVDRILRVVMYMDVQILEIEQ